jgi:glutamate:Na+ symporter, ESS family
MTPWNGVLDFTYLGAGLVLATVLRARVGLLQKFLIPNNIVAGFICFFFGSAVIGLVDVDPDSYGNYVYHLLAITFVSMALRSPNKKRNLFMVSTGFILTLGIGIQAFIGLAIACGFALTVLPDLFPTFGYYLMLGFSQGPGQSYALGKTWEPLGLENGGNIGLTFAAIGFIWACFVGVALVHFSLRKSGRSLGEQIDRVSKTERTGIVGPEEASNELNSANSAGRLTTASAAIDSLAFHLAMIGIVYGGTYAILRLVEKVVLSGSPSPMLEHLMNTMWGIHFVFASFLALLFRRVLNRVGRGHLLDDGILTRISGSSLDFMVCAAIAAISFTVVLKYAAPIFVTTTLGGLATVFFVLHAIRISRLSHAFERMLSIFGTLTGTLSTGLTLSRIVDPEFKSPAPAALVLATAVTLPLSIPLIVSSFIPIHYWQAGAGPAWIYGPILLLTGFYSLGLYLFWRFVIVPRTESS